MEKKFKIGLIGLGAIGSSLADKIKSDNSLELIFVYDSDKNKLSDFSKELIVTTLAEMKTRNPDLVVEAASQEAVKEFAAKILEFARFMPMSVGALIDEVFLGELKAIAKSNNTNLIIPAGAIIGLDGIEAVRDLLENVTIESRKNPKGFGRDDKEETILFEGSAKDACPKFPKNVNVSAALSLYGIGTEKTKVRLVSDPKCTVNSHLIIAEGSFGKFTIKVENKPSKNPKTSGTVPFSAYATIKRIQKCMGYF